MPAIYTRSSRCNPTVLARRRPFASARILSSFWGTERTSHLPNSVRTCHDWRVIPITEKNIDAWLTPEGRTVEELFAILDERERPYYEHRLAA